MLSPLLSRVDIRAPATDNVQRIAQRRRRARAVRTKRRAGNREHAARSSPPTSPCPASVGTPSVSASCVVRVTPGSVRRRHVDRRTVVGKADVAAKVDRRAVGRGVAVTVGDRRRRRQASPGRWPGSRTGRHTEPTCRHCWHGRSPQTASASRRQSRSPRS